MNEHPHNRPVIVLDRDYFEHLLNCLANQKYLHYINADAFGQCSEEIRKIQEQNQRVIDDAHAKGREMLTNCLQEDMREQEQL